jgi:glycolate oxidase
MPALTVARGRPAQVDADRARLALARYFGPSQLLVDEESREAHRRDASEVEGEMPVAVVLARSSADVQRCLRCAAEARIPVVPRGGGTGKAGAASASAGAVVLSTLGFDAIKEIDAAEGLAVVEPGVTLAHFQKAVAAAGLFYPPDPCSSVGCAIGGNVATNAGGPRAFKYGVTGRYVLGIEAFLIGGERVKAGRRTSKGVTGYDLTSLLVGSEGTLAVFGDVTLRLIRPPESALTMLVPFAKMANAAAAVVSIVEQQLGPSCLELLDARELSALSGDLGAGSGAESEAFLLLEVDGSPQGTRARAERIAAACARHASGEARWATGARERDELWAVRADLSARLRRSARYKLSEDVAVPRRQLPELIRQIDAISRRRSVRSVAYGHAGDGNLHVNFLWDDTDDAPRVQLAIRELFERAVTLGGTLTGEHGLGVLKAPYLPLEQSGELVALQRGLKRAFDPHNLLNPGKMFPPSAFRV